MRDKVLIFSDRISSEILIKAAKIDVEIILSKSAPTSLAIQLAKDLYITAIEFIRENHFNSQLERIINQMNFKVNISCTITFQLIKNTQDELI